MEWLAAMCSHIPNRREQMVRYYGYYSNVSRGKRQKEGIDFGKLGQSVISTAVLTAGLVKGVFGLTIINN